MSETNLPAPAESPPEISPEAADKVTMRAAAVPYREKIAAAQQAGDHAKANALYQEQLQAMAAAADGGEDASQPTDGLPALSVAPAETVDAVLTALDHLEPESANELRALWPGEEMGRNLGAVGWLENRYNLPEVETNAQFLRAGVNLAKQVYSEVHPGEALPPPLPPETVAEFLAVYDEDEAETMRYGHGGDLAQNLALAGWMLREYGGGGVLDSEANILRVKAGIARGVRADLANVRTTRTPQTTDTSNTSNEVRAMDINEYEEKLAELRARSSKAQAEGDSKKANRLYQEQLALIAARDGDRPIVGGGGRTV